MITLILISSTSKSKLIYHILYNILGYDQVKCITMLPDGSIYANLLM